MSNRRELSKRIAAIEARMFSTKLQAPCVWLEFADGRSEWLGGIMPELGSNVVNVTFVPSGARIGSKIE